MDELHRSVAGLVSKKEYDQTDNHNQLLWAAQPARRQHHP
jgi:hypothetical protein